MFWQLGFLTIFRLTGRLNMARAVPEPGGRFGRGLGRLEQAARNGTARRRERQEGRSVDGLHG
jgi:hypothetical protein